MDTHSLGMPIDVFLDDESATSIRSDAFRRSGDAKVHVARVVTVVACLVVLGSAFVRQPEPPGRVTGIRDDHQPR